MNLINIILEEAENVYSHKKYKSWKRKNVTLRGEKNVGEFNGGGARFGDGLYTAYLSNKKMAKEYGDVLFYVGARPKNPKKVNDTNEAENFLYYKIILPYLEKNNLEKRSSEFYKHTDIKTEMLNNGYDGLDIVGREVVNYTPPELGKGMWNYRDERQVINHYIHYVLNNKDI
jgi:hypothetical protein